MNGNVCTYFFANIEVLYFMQTITSIKKADYCQLWSLSLTTVERNGLAPSFNRTGLDYN